MTGLLSGLVTALRTAIAGAWPETVEHGIWLADEALMRSYERDMATPYAVIDLAGFEPTGDFGVANHTWSTPFMISYVAETEGDFTTLQERLETLNQYFDEHPLATGQVFPRPCRMAMGRDLESNSLLILLNATQRSGVVAGTALVGWSPTAS